MSDGSPPPIPPLTLIAALLLLLLLLLFHACASQQIFSAVGENDKALKCFDKAIELDEKNANPYVHKVLMPLFVVSMVSTLPNRLSRLFCTRCLLLRA